MADDNIVALIRERALASGVDPATLTRIAQIESNLNPNAQPPINPTTGQRASTATGLFQFVQPTWRTWGGGADPRDPYANADAGARFTAANIAGLKASGFEPTPANTYLAHFSGLGGARKVLSSPDNARVIDVLGADVVKANPFLANMTVADMRNWASTKMGGAAAAPAVRRPVSPAAPSQTGAVPVAPQNVASDEDQLLRTLQTLSSPAEQPSAPTPRINIAMDPQQQARIERARKLAAAMAQNPIA